MNSTKIRREYQDVKRACQKDWMAPLAGRALLKMAKTSLEFLNAQAEQIALISKVPGKQYISFRLADTVARPANKALYVADYAQIKSWWGSFYKATLASDEVSRLLYTMALAPCLAMELLDRQNKKGPATYFECLVGHLFARDLSTQPMKKASLPVQGRQVRLTMDFLFQTPKEKPNLHLPVKMSTRERVVQAWSHQRLLDGAFGRGTYEGKMVIFSETKLNSKSLEVVEICVPDQWLAYQTLLSKMKVIYYFDAPNRYMELTTKYPELIEIRPFTEYFSQ